MAARPVKKEKVTEASRYAWSGEELELSPEVGYDLRARYRQAAVALHAAKAEAFKIEEEIKTAMGGHEHATVNGERIFSWAWKLKTTFDKTALRRAHPAIEQEFTVRVENGSRAFSAPGVSGVE